MQPKSDVKAILEPMKAINIIPTTFKWVGDPVEEQNKCFWLSSKVVNTAILCRHCNPVQRYRTLCLLDFDSLDWSNIL